MIRPTFPMPHLLGFKRLRWLFILAVLPAVVMLSLFAYLTYQRESRLLQTGILQTSRALSQLVDLELLGIAEHVQSFGNTHESLAEESVAAFQAHMSKEFVDTGVAAGIRLIDQDGQQRIDSFVPVGTSLTDIANRNEIDQVLSTGKTHISNLITNTATQRPMITIDTPIFQDGKVRYVLQAVYSPDQLNRFLRKQNLPPGWLAVVFDRAGTILARSVNADKYVGRKLIKPALSLLGKDEDNLCTGRTQEGTNSLFVFHRSAQTGLGVGVAVPTETLYAGLRSQYELFAAAILVFTFGSIMLALWLGGLLETDHNAQERLHDLHTELDRLVELKTSSLRDTLDQLKETQFAMNKAGIGILRLDLDTVSILWANEYATNRLGYTLEELLTLKVPDIDLGFTEERHQAIVEMLHQRDSARFETSIRTKTGQIIPAEVICHMLRVDGAPSSRIIIFATDISERKKTEAELHAMGAEMEQLGHVQIARQTVAALAHELHQPLNAITTYAGAALRLFKAGNADQTKLQQAIDGSAKQAQRAGHVVRELLAFLNQGVVETVPLYLNNLTRSAIDRIKAESAVQFEVDLLLEPNLPQVKANRLQVEKVLMNLIRNGIEAMHGNSKERKIGIAVRTSREPGMVQVTVRDSGPGIDPAVASRIFDPFFTTKSRGVGMGLAVSRAIVEAHGGKLWVESEPGAGAIFHFTLPFAT